ncbi:hypothetical protein D3C80_1363620 [compost metagenome]
MSVGQADPTIIHCRISQVRLAATGIQGLFEYAVTAIVGSHAEHVAHLQTQGTLVALVAVSAISVAHIGLGIATRTRENVLAVLVTAVHQAVELLFELSQLLRVSFAIGIGVAAVTSANRQLLDSC